jgi:hypothetical protein
MRLALIFTMMCLLLSCDSEITVEKSFYDAKMREIDSLKQVIDYLTHGAPQLLALVKEEINNGDIQAASDYSEELNVRFPESKESLEAKGILDKSKEKIREIDERKKKEIGIALKSMNKKRDDMRGVTIFRDKSAPIYVNSKSWIGAYIIKPDNSQPVLRLVIYYTSDEWLFIRRYIVKSDDQTFTLTPDDYGPDAVETDNGSGGIWEWWDVVADGDKLAMLRTLSDSKVAKIRYEGRQYYKDRAIGAAERASLKRTIQAFEQISKGGTR